MSLNMGYSILKQSCWKHAFVSSTHHPRGETEKKEAPGREPANILTLKDFPPKSKEKHVMLNPIEKFKVAMGHSIFYQYPPMDDPHV